MAITGYRSPVDLQLGQVPKTTDPQLFDEMTDIYNAIHLLNQYLDQLRVTAEGGGGSGVSPADSMPFNRFYTAPGLAIITAGQLISPSNIAGENGVRLGGLASDPTATNPSCNAAYIALSSITAIGQDVSVGIGPAILAAPGFVSGQIAWGYSAKANNGAVLGNGNLYGSNPGPVPVGGGNAYAMPVAVCIRDGFLLFGPALFQGNT